MERYQYGERNQTRTGTLGWVGVGAAVLAAEIICEESLTHAFRRGLDSNRYRPFLLGGMAITSLHLLDLLPSSVDPYRYLEVGLKAGQNLVRQTRHEGS